MHAHPSEHRLHPIALVLFVGGQLKEVVFLLLTALIGSGGDLFSSLAGVAFFGGLVGLLVVAPAVSRLLTFRYRVGDDELVIRWGWLARKERHIPFGRIQSLDARARVLHRLFGTVEVIIETGGGDEAEGRIAAIPMADFEAMRGRVLEGRRAPALRDAPPVDAGAATMLAELGPRDLLLTGLILNRGMVLVGAAVAIVYELGLGDRITERLLGPAVAERGFFLTVLDLSRGALHPTASELVVGVAMLVGFVMVVRLLSMVFTIVRYHDHRLEQIGGDLRVSCGLLTRSTSTTPIRRIQSLTVREGPWHRLAGRVTVQVATAGGVQFEESAPSRETLAPLLRVAELPRVLEVALDGLAVPREEWRPAARPAARRQLMRSALWWMVPVAVAWWWGVPAGTVATLLMLGSAVAAQRRVRQFRWAAFDGGVAIRTGWLFRRTTIARHDRIQLAVVEESPFDRRHGMAEVAVDTAGSEAPALQFTWLLRSDAVHLARGIDAALARTEFRL